MVKVRSCALRRDESHPFVGLHRIYRWFWSNVGVMTYAPAKRFHRDPREQVACLSSLWYAVLPGNHHIHKRD